MTTARALYERHWRASLPHESADGGEIVEMVKRALAPVDRLLDVGTGAGRVVTFARDRCRAVHGCDLAQPAAQAARDAGAHSVCADVNEGLPYRSDSFDTVTCLDVVEHVLDPIQLLAETRRVLRPGGTLLLSTPNIRYVRHVARLVVSGEFPHTSPDAFVWGGGHVHYFTRRDLARVLARAGFSSVRFSLNAAQFERSWKRRWLVRAVGRGRFGEWLCAGIFATAVKA